MDVKEVVVHEVDGSRQHMMLEELADGAVALGLEPAEMESDALRRAVALLSIYRSRVDFLKQREIESGVESLLQRFKRVPAGHDPSAIH